MVTKKRKYSKTSPHWSKSKLASVSTAADISTVKPSTKLDTHISELEEMTGYKFKPSEILRLAFLLK